MDKVVSNNSSDIIVGRNAVLEALKNNRAIDKILLSKSANKAMISNILSLAKKNSVVIKQVDNKKLNLMCPDIPHQGIIAIAAIKKYSTIQDMLNLAEKRNQPPFLIIADSLEDPHNLGAIIRTAECAGAHGIIISKRNCVGLTATVGKASAGAIEYMPIAKVTNIVNTIKELKQLGIWVYGADMNGESLYNTKLEGPIALVIGSEGFGISRLVKENCDVMLSLPMKGKINSLNASVAAGILMFEISRQRII